MMSRYERYNKYDRYNKYGMRRRRTKLMEEQAKEVEAIRVTHQKIVRKMQTLNVAMQGVEAVTLKFTNTPTVEGPTPSFYMHVHEGEYIGESIGVGVGEEEDDWDQVSE